MTISPVAVALFSGTGYE